MSNGILLAVGGGLALCVIGLAIVVWKWRRRRKDVAVAAQEFESGKTYEPAPPPLVTDWRPRQDLAPTPGPDQIAPSEQVIDVMALIGNALVLQNGTFVRMIEVMPVDLERGDASLKARFWSSFADVMRRIRPPLGIQIVVTTSPQDISPYLKRWEEAARKWMLRSERSVEPHDRDRRARMAVSALETGGFLLAAHERLMPMQQRYLIVVFHNPFPEAHTKKKQEHVLNPKVVHEALDQLEENVQMVRAAFSSLSLPMYDLDPPSMCLALWEHYHHPPSILGANVAAQVALDLTSAAQSSPVPSGSPVTPATGRGGRGDGLWAGASNEGTEQNGNGRGNTQKRDNGAGGNPVPLGGPSAAKLDFTLTPAHLAQRPAADDFLQAANDPEQLADLLAPALIDEQPTYIRVGEVVARGFTIYDFDPSSPVDFSALLAFEADMTHSLYLWPTDPVNIRRQFKEKETELKSGQLVDERRGVVTNWGRQAAIETVENARAEIEIAMQAPFFLHWFCMIWANDVLALEKKCQQFETRLKVMDIRYHPATRVQRGVLQSCRPLGRMSYQLKPRNMSADSLGPFFPFARREYFDPNGVHFGVHRGNGLLVCLDVFQNGQSNASELVLGTPGSGKSVYLKQEIETLLALGHRVFIIDPEREYLRLAVDYHAPYLELGKRRTEALIPFPAPEAAGAAEDAWVEGLLEVGQIFESLSAQPLSSEQANILTTHYQSVMEAAGIIYSQPETWTQTPPPMTALVESLQGVGQPQPPSVGELGAEARELGRVLSYVSDSLAGGHQINIMDINLDSDEPWIAAAQSLAAFVEAILGRALSATSFNSLVGCYRITMEKWGFDADVPETWNHRAPTLSALADVLANDLAPESRELAAVLEQYAHGLYKDLFNCETSLDLSQAQLAVFGMRSLRENVEKSLAPVFAWQVLRLVWNAVVAGGAVQPTHLFIDEAWYVLEQPGAASRLERMGRSFRKYHAALHIATQEIKRLVENPEAEAIANVGGMTVLFGQETESAVRALGDVLGLSAGEQGEILRMSKGEALLLGAGKLRLPIYVAVNPMRLEHLSTNVAQQKAVARAAGRRVEPVL